MKFLIFSPFYCGQIDVRVLKAVAIEHSKDVDEAVVAVIDEIIPFLASHSVCDSE